MRAHSPEHRPTLIAVLTELAKNAFSYIDDAKARSATAHLQEYIAGHWIKFLFVGNRASKWRLIVEMAFKLRHTKHEASFVKYLQEGLQRYICDYILKNTGHYRKHKTLGLGVSTMVDALKSLEPAFVADNFLVTLQKELDSKNSFDRADVAEIVSRLERLFEVASGPEGRDSVSKQSVSKSCL